MFVLSTLLYLDKFTIGLLMTNPNYRGARWPLEVALDVTKPITATGNSTCLVKEISLAYHILYDNVATFKYNAKIVKNLIELGLISGSTIKKVLIYTYPLKCSK